MVLMLPQLVDFYFRHTQQPDLQRHFLTDTVPDNTESLGGQGILRIQSN